MTVRVSVNGDPREVAPGTTVGQVVAEITGLPAETVTGVAAALNGEIVPRGTWPAAALTEGDQVEVVTAVQGG